MDLKLDSTGDLEFTNNDLVIVDGIDAIKQHLHMRLMTFLGEEFQDETRGVPWFTELLVKNPSFLVIGEILKNVILDTPGITDIISFVFDLSGRTATLDFKVLSVNGFIDFSDQNALRIGI